MRVTLRGSSTLLDQILTVSAPGTGTLYVPQSLSFRADGATAILSFADVSLTTDCVDMLLDNVRVSDGKFVHDKGPELSGRQQEIPSPRQLSALNI